MVIFSSNADQSSIEFYYGVGFTTPKADANLAACYDVKYVTNGDGTTTLTATRPLECAAGITDLDGGAYVVQLDTSL